MNKLLLSIIGIAASASLLILFFTPSPPAHPEIKTQMAFIFPTVIFGIGAITFFLRSLRSFKPGLRIAYTLLALGIILVPIPETMIASVYMFKLDVAKLPILSIISLLALAFATPLLYFGMRKFAQLVSVHNIWTKLKFVIPIITVISVILGIYGPGLLLGQSNPLYFSGFFIAFNSILYAVTTTIIAVRVKTLLGPAYLSAMQYLTAAFGMTAFAYIHDATTSTFLTVAKITDSPYLAYALWPYLISNILFLCAGYQFWKTSRQIGNDIDAHATYIDTITSIANLISNPRALDVSLDKLRIITASNAQNKNSLSAHDKTTLLDLYLEIESYLTTKDPLRTYKVADLRSHLTYDFQQALKAHSHPASNT